MSCPLLKSLFNGLAFSGLFKYSGSPKPHKVTISYQITVHQVYGTVNARKRRDHDKETAVGKRRRVDNIRQRKGCTSPALKAIRGHTSLNFHRELTDHFSFRFFEMQIRTDSRPARIHRFFQHFTSTYSDSGVER